MSLWNRLGMLVGGVLIGTAGIAVLSSSDAKKVYVHAAAAAKRCGDAVMKTVTVIRENYEDICAEADDLNENRARMREEREIADAKAVLEKYEVKSPQDEDK